MKLTIDYVLGLEEDEETKCCSCGKTWKFTRAAGIWYELTGLTHYCPFCGHPQGYVKDDSKEGPEDDNFWEARDDFINFLYEVALEVTTKQKAVKTLAGLIAELRDEIAALKRSRTAVTSVNTRLKNKLNKIQEYFGINADAALAVRKEARKGDKE